MPRPAVRDLDLVLHRRRIRARSKVNREVGGRLSRQIAQQRRTVHQDEALAAGVFVVDARDGERDHAVSDRESEPVARSHVMPVGERLADNGAVASRQRAQNRIAIFAAQEAQTPVTAHDLEIAGAERGALAAIMKVDRTEFVHRGDPRDRRDQWRERPDRAPDARRRPAGHPAGRRDRREAACRARARRSRGNCRP